MVREERVKLGLQLWSLNQRRALCRAEGRLLLSGRRNLGRSLRERQSRRSTSKGQLWLLPSRWACHPFTTPPQYHLDSQGLQAKQDGYFVHPHAHVIALWSNYQVNSCHWKAFFSYYSELQICSFRDLGNIYPDTFVFPVGKQRPRTRSGTCNITGRKVKIRGSKEAE